jgi:pimeloyl-ACP methyl ester carboxylesterase
MSPIDLVVREHYVTTPDGWTLHLRQTISPLHFDAATKPLLIVPGYGMNTFIFSFHPKGTSLERCLAEGGFEVWSVNLRGQGPTRATRRSAEPPSMQRYATIDVPVAVDHVLQHTETSSRRLTMVGCSLGGSIAYTHLALCTDHRVAELITMGAPLRWTQVHPLLRVLFASPRVAASLRISGTRRILRSAVPVLLRAPSLLRMYMNAATIDMRCLPDMSRTVEDPDPNVNRDISHWLRDRDLELGGVNVTQAMKRQRLPLLVVLSNRDGIVPESVALSAAEVWGGPDVEVLRVGDENNWYAHANLFVADDAPALVFDPIIRWLRRLKATPSMMPPAR